jgi:hypothetical protein
MFQRLFLTHPRRVGESYLQHQRVAFSFAFSLLGAGMAAFLHALVPGLCERSARDAIRKLHARLEQR